MTWQRSLLSKSSIYFCASVASIAPYLCATVSISHHLDESQGLWCGWADVVHSAFLKAPYWGALIGGNWSSVASIATQVDKTFHLLLCDSTPASVHILPIVGQLKGNLYVGVWTHFLFLYKLLPIVVEFVDINVQIIHQPERMRTHLVINVAFLNMYIA